MKKRIITVNSRDFVITQSRGAAREADLPALQSRIAADARDHNALSLLGRAYFDMGKLDDAVDALTLAIEINADEASYHNQLGQCFYALKNSAEAMRHALEALRLDNRFAEAHLTAGFALIEMKKPREAVAHFNAALKINPVFHDAYIGIGRSYSLMGWHDKALRCMERARKLRPDDSMIHVVIGEVLESAKRYEEAIACFRTALELDAENASTHVGLADTLVVMGKLKESITHTKRAVELNPGNLAQLINSLVQSGHEVDEETLELAEKMLDDPKSNELGAVEGFMFALARYYDKAGNYGRSIALLKEGGKRVKQRKNIAYSAAETDKATDRIIEVFTEENIRRLSRGGLSDDTPIFVLGMMRSGTTLVEQILSSHPQVHGAGELSFMQHLCERFDARFGKPFPENFWEMNEASCNFLARQYLQYLRVLAPESKYIVDKMPHNFRFIGAIKSMLPNARIIHCVRNPIDTCLSGYQQLFAADHPQTYDLGDLGHYYCAYSRLMRHWNTLFADSIHDVVYEELVSNPEAGTRKLLDACGLPFDEACLSFFSQERPVATASYFQVRHPVYRDSVEKWKRYEPYIGELIQSLSPCLEHPLAKSSLIDMVRNPLLLHGVNP